MWRGGVGAAIILVVGQSAARTLVLFMALLLPVSLAVVACGGVYEPPTAESSKAAADGVDGDDFTEPSFASVEPTRERAALRTRQLVSNVASRVSPDADPRAPPPAA